MSTDDLESKLKGSSSFASLSAEQTICNDLNRLGWRAVHGAFYKDKTTEKIREVDVIGQITWEKNLKGYGQTAFLNLVIEAKSAKGFHILLSPTKADDVSCQNIWLGTDVEDEGAVANRLTQLGIEAQRKSAILKKLVRISYPHEFARAGSLRINPAFATDSACAFREMNIGSEKELDNSVVWKAAQSLSSTIEGLKQEFEKSILEDLAIPFHIEKITGRRMEKEVSDQLRLITSIVEIYHPIIVIDAQLWMVQQKSLRKIQWCRFLQKSARFGDTRWFDIVNSNYFNKYAQQLTKYYFSAYRKTKSVRR